MWKKFTKAGKVQYYERYTDPMNGKKRDVSVTFAKDTPAARREASLILAKRIAERMEQSYAPEVEGLRVAELIRLYLKDNSKNVKASTFKRNEFAAKKLQAFLGPDTYVSRLSAVYVRNKLLETGKRGVTLNEYLARFKSIMKWAYKSDLVSSVGWLDKLDRFPDIPHSQKISDKFMESSELKALIDEMQQPLWKLLTQFLALSGLRIGEALALTAEDIDYTEKVIHVKKTYDYRSDVVTSPKTVASYGDVLMQPELEAVIKEARILSLKSSLSQGYRTDLIFAGPDGGHAEYYAYCKYLRENTERVIGRPLSPHSLRHTHASLLFEQGFTLDEVSRRLRHSKSAITRDIYIHVTKKLREKDAEKLSKISLLSV